MDCGYLRGVGTEAQSLELSPSDNEMRQRCVCVCEIGRERELGLYSWPEYADRSTDSMLKAQGSAVKYAVFHSNCCSVPL